MNDLFTSAAADRLRSRAPLAARLRPTRLDEVVGQEHLTQVGKPLRRMIESGRLTSILLWGPAGTGKTSIAEVIANSIEARFVRIEAVNSGVKDIREAIDGAARAFVEQGVRTVVFVDEIHRFSKSQQDALLPAVEDGTIVLVGATTENPMFEVNGPLRSRATLFRLEPLTSAAIEELLRRGCVLLDRVIDEDASVLITERCLGDGRAALTALEVAAAIGEGPTIDRESVVSALSTSPLRYGRDDHYDVVSALIKSIRGSAVDASLHWLARMLESGERPEFIARRLVILASEDIGVADSTALHVAVAAAHAVSLVGMPEAHLNLAHAVIHLAQAPKSAAVSRAIHRALVDVRAGRVATVPAHLRDSHYSGAGVLGHGLDYVSPHDDPQAAAEGGYLPSDFGDTGYFGS